MTSATESSGSWPVKLYVYDLTRGMARQLSPMLLGQQIDGVWHTSLVIENEEIFFGYGVQQTIPGTTPFGAPLQIVDLGVTVMSKEVRDELLADIATSKYQPIHYSLLTNNCNHFTNDFASILTGQGIPAHILSQVELVMRTPMGQMLMPMLLQMEGQLGGATATGFAASAPTTAQQQSSGGTGARPH